MRNLDNIKSSNNKKTSHIDQMKESFLSRFEEVLNRSPKILDAFWQNWRLDKCESPDRVEVIKNNENNENKYLKITIQPWDKKDFRWWTERAEIQQSKKIEYGQEYIQNFSFQIPKDFGLCPRRTVIRQWKRSPEITRNDCPLLSHRIKKIWGEYFLVLTHWKVLEDWERESIWEKIKISDIIWKNVTIQSKIKFSDKWESVVNLEMDCEWKKIPIYDWPIIIPHLKSSKDDAQAYFKFGIYRDRYKYAIRKIKKNKKLEPEEKKVQIEEMKKIEEKEREVPSYIFLKDYNIKEFNMEESDK